MQSLRVHEDLADLRRLAVARTLREHPEWSLEDVLGVIERGGPRAAVLGELTIADLAAAEANEVRPAVDHSRRWRAIRLRGAQFDQLVFEVLCEAPGEVASGYLRAQLGGPRWKLKDSLERLIAAGKVVKRGMTSATRYRAVQVRV